MPHPTFPPRPAHRPRPAGRWLPRSATPSARPLMLANVYRPELPLADYWVSEKYDGVRAYWDGQQLWTRHGHRIARARLVHRRLAHAAARRRAVGRARPLHRRLIGRGPRHPRRRRMARTALHGVRSAGAPRPLRRSACPTSQRLLAGSTNPVVQAVPQHKLADDAALASPAAARPCCAGGEGLMLHRGASLYRGERNDDLLKLKQHLDAEATVIGHVPGKGKYQGMLGALLVQTPEGLRVPAGQRAARRRSCITAPPIGSQVTYRYLGLHPNGAPRFASFVRVRRTELSPWHAPPGAAPARARPAPAACPAARSIRGPARRPRRWPPSPTAGCVRPCTFARRSKMRPPRLPSRVALGVQRLPVGQRSRRGGSAPCAASCRPSM